MEKFSVQDLQFYNPACLKVLLVDNNIESRQKVKLQLSKHEYQVETLCSSLSEAVGLLGKQIYDIILSELLLFEEATDEDIKQLKQFQRKVPLIVYSKNCPNNLIYKAIKYGAADYWEKPFCESQVKTVWQHVLRKTICNLQKPQNIGLNRSRSDINGRQQCNKYDNNGLQLDNYQEDQQAGNKQDVVNKQNTLKKYNSDMKLGSRTQKDCLENGISKVDKPSNNTNNNNNNNNSNNNNINNTNNTNNNNNSNNNNNNNNNKSSGLNCQQSLTPENCFDNNQLLMQSFQNDSMNPYLQQSPFQQQQNVQQPYPMMPFPFQGMFNGMSPMPFMPFPQMLGYPQPMQDGIPPMQNQFSQGQLQQFFQSQGQGQFPQLKDQRSQHLPEPPPHIQPQHKQQQQQQHLVQQDLTKTMEIDPTIQHNSQIAETSNTNTNTNLKASTKPNPTRSDQNCCSASNKKPTVRKVKKVVKHGRLIKQSQSFKEVMPKNQGLEIGQNIFKSESEGYIKAENGQELDTIDSLEDIFTSQAEFDEFHKEISHQANHNSEFCNILLDD